MQSDYVCEARNSKKKYILSKNQRKPSILITEELPRFRKSLK